MLIPLSLMTALISALTPTVIANDDGKPQLVDFALLEPLSLEVDPKEGRATLKTPDGYPAIWDIGIPSNGKFDMRFNVTGFDSKGFKGKRECHLTQSLKPEASSGQYTFANAPSFMAPCNGEENGLSITCSGPKNDCK